MATVNDCIQLITYSVFNNPRHHLFTSSDNWTTHLPATLDPLYDWGLRRFFLWNPFGTNSVTGTYEFDQWLNARAEGLRYLTDDFIHAMTTWKAAHPDARVGCYIGYHLRADTRPRVRKSLYPFLKTRCDVGFDASSAQPQRSKVYKHALRLVQRDCLKSYTEAWPVATAPALSKFGTFCSIELFPDRTMWGIQPDSKISGEIIRIINNPAPGHFFYETGWEQAHLSSVLAAYQSPVCGYFSRLKEQGLPLSSVF